MKKLVMIKSLSIFLFAYLIAMNSILAAYPPGYMPRMNKWEKAKKYPLKRLDKLIKKAKSSNETLEQSISRIDKEMDISFFKQTAKLAKMLSKKSERKIRKKLARRIKKIKKRIQPNGELIAEMEKMLQNKNVSIKALLAKEISYEKHQQKKNELLDQIKDAGSWEKYLQNYKEKIRNASVSVTTRNNKISRGLASYHPNGVATYILGLLLITSGVGILLLSALFLSPIWLIVAIPLVFLIGGIGLIYVIGD